MVRIEGEYTGDLRVVSKHMPSGTELVTDAPVDNQGKGASFSPTDLVATALVTCIATTIGIKARSMGIDIDGLKMFVEKEMGTDAPRRIARLTGGFEFTKPVEAADREVLMRIAKACPVHRSLSADVQKRMTFRWSDGSEDVVEG